MPSSNFQVLFDTTPEHLRPHDIALLDELRNEDNTFKPGAPAPIYGFEYGWTVSVSGGAKGSMADEGELARWRAAQLGRFRDAGFSEEFCALVRHAWENGAVMIRFDRDAEPEPGFPLFEFETGRMYDDGTGEEPSSPTP